MVDTYLRGPLHVARSTEMGSAKALKSGMSNSIGTTFLFSLIVRDGATWTKQSILLIMYRYLMQDVKKLVFISLIFVLLTNCSNNTTEEGDITPEAWLIHEGMSKDEVLAVLEKEDLYYTESEKEIDVENEIEYLDQNWDSMDISFNDEGKVDKVAFYRSEENGRIDNYALIDILTKKLGEPTGSIGVMTTWSNEEKWMVTFADNEQPYPQTLTYWYIKYMPEDKSENSENESLE